MRRIYLFFFTFLCIATLLLIACQCSKKTDSDLNLDFENVENGMPKGWQEFQQESNYSISLDSDNVKSGKYAIFIESLGDSVSFQAIQLVLPANYEGEKITLSGYIKTENVVDGYAGLLIRIDPGIAFNIMHKTGITGTSDWKKYEITLAMNPTETEKIVIGGLLTGKGKMWLDNLKVTIDGKDIGKVKPYQQSPFPAQNDRAFDTGSNIIFPKLDKQKIDDLELLGRIWGFLKYHHPAAATGKYNWDYELFRMLPDYLKANSNQQRDKVLIRWINKYGKIHKCETCEAIPDSAFIKPDISWIKQSKIDQKLKATLYNIYLNRSRGYHYYIRMDANVGNPIFANERTYEVMNDLDAGFRLLALYRYWNMIYYFFPSKYLTDKNWNVVLNEYIPYFIEAKTRLEYELTTARLITEVCDSHAFLMGFNRLESMKGAGQVLADVRFIENKLVIVKNNTEHNDFKKGDIITHIDGKTVEAIVDSMKNYYPASNETARMRDIANDLLRTDKNTLLIDCISSGKIEQKKISVSTRSKWEYFKYRSKDTTKSYKFIDKNIGYITLKTIKDEDIPIIKKEFMNTKGVVIDIRNYPSAFVVFSLGSYFISKDNPFVKFTNGNSDNPGEFSFTSPIEIQKSDETYHGKLVVLVNEETQSSAEYHAMAFRAGNNTTIIGSQTTGADGNISKIVLPGGLETRISGIGVYYSDGKSTQRIGIVPDIIAKPTIKGIKEGRDELLEKAIEIIRNDK